MKFELLNWKKSKGLNLETEGQELKLMGQIEFYLHLITWTSIICKTIG
jgi:hypothetical protein